MANTITVDPIASGRDGSNGHISAGSERPAVGTAHGKPLRGLSSTPSSPNYQGRFGRMFRSLPRARYGHTDHQSQEALKELGKAMSADLEASNDAPDPEESGIPALYTYFGQFVDHDITFDPMSSLIKRSDPDALSDFRTPTFDLDNVYGRGPDDQPYMYEAGGKKFLLGDKLDNGAFDLPRNNAPVKRALIGDPRNDENSIVSQLQALILRFHNRIVDDNPALDFEAVQQQVRFYYQWVVMHDFLPKIVNQSVLHELKTHERYDPHKLRFYHYRNDPFMPVEFSVAAYRYGHSMVRPAYRLNDAVRLPIFKAAAEPDDLAGFREMNKAWGIDWARFIDVERRAYGRPDIPADPSNLRRLQLAYRIDTSLVNPLSVLPSPIASSGPISLAQRNLIRGFELGLPNGQSVARWMGIQPLEDEQIVIGKSVDKPEDGDVAGTIASLPNLSVFQQNCPLWTYILAEAAQKENRADLTIPVTGSEMTVSTPQLGPVGGRIVAEVFLGMLAGDKDSQINIHPHWTPSLSNGGEFRLKDLVAYALGS